MIKYGQTNVNMVSGRSKLPYVQCHDLFRGQNINIWQTFAFSQQITYFEKFVLMDMELAYDEIWSDYVIIVSEMSKLPYMQCHDLFIGQNINIWQTFAFSQPVTKFKKFVFINMELAYDEIWSN